MSTHRTKSTSCRTDSQTRDCAWDVLDCLAAHSSIFQSETLVRPWIWRPRHAPELKPLFWQPFIPNRNRNTNWSDYSPPFPNADRSRFRWPFHFTVEAGQAAVPVVSTKTEAPINRFSVQWRQMSKPWTSCRCRLLGQVSTPGREGVPLGESQIWVVKFVNELKGFAS